MISKFFQKWNSSSLTFQYFDSFAFDETLSVIFYGKTPSVLGQVLFFLSFITSFGLTGLLALWLPNFRSWATMKDCHFNKASHIFVKTCQNKMELVRIKEKAVACPLKDIFQKFCYKENSDSMVLRFFEYQNVSFLYNPFTGKFVSSNQFPEFEIGQTDNIQRQKIIFGENAINIKAKSLRGLMADQLVHPFTVFQAVSVIIWSCEEYQLYAACIFVMTLFSLIMTVKELRQGSEKIKKLIRHSQYVSIRRNGKWCICSSEDLVPGDIFALNATLTEVPCDAVLICGDVIVDESMLTGETTPVIKGPVSLDLLEGQSVGLVFKNQKHSLYAGTRLLRVQTPVNIISMALVYRTGFLTQKGSMIQSILFPRPDNFQFHKDSMLFIGILGAIALVVFSISVVNLTLMGVSIYYIATRALDLITVILPPALPATLSIGIAAAMKRLKKSKIMCINPSKINVASKIDRICFDKTGTLTEDGLKIHHIVSFSKHNLSETIFENRLADQLLLLETNPELYMTLGMCHSLLQFRGRIVGDPLEVEMFSFTDLKLPEPAEEIGNTGKKFLLPSSKPGNKFREFILVKEYEFTPELRRMSVLVKDPSYEQCVVLTKGSPEYIKNLCCPESVPNNFDALLNNYSSNGYRVIACASRVVDSIHDIDGGVNRDVFENELVFAGFIVFENKLKGNTLPVLHELTSANFKISMATGDNVLTAVSVGRASKLFKEQEVVYFPVSYGPNFMQLWGVDPKSGLKLKIQLEALAGHVTIACSGEQFEGIASCLTDRLMRKFLDQCSIFGRMSPMQKKKLVEKYQKMGECICFCGDGANDCAALMASDVGVSLSQAEASVAAPFTSNICDISSIPIILKNGRSSIVTSFVSFKFMSLYSIIQFTTLSFLYTFGSSLSDWQFIYFDLFLILPLGILINQYSPSNRLSMDKPSSKLICSPVLLSIFSQMILQALFQGLIFFYIRRNYQPTPFVDGPNVENVEATSLAMFSSFIYLTQAIVFSEGRPHRQSRYVPLVVYSIAIFTLNIVLVVGRIEWLDELMQFVHLKFLHRIFILVMALIYMLLAHFINTIYKNRPKF